MNAGPDDILERFRGFNVCQISDALGPSHPVESSIRPIDTKFTICGKVVTCLCETDDNLAVLRALAKARKGTS
jgi:regulator of RNase E activity RraA